MGNLLGSFLRIGKKHFRLVLLFALVAPIFVSGAVTVITRMDWPRAYGGPYDVYYQGVPTTLTSQDTRDVHLLGYCVANPTAGAITFTMQTNDTSPLALPISGSIPANTSVCNNTPWGLLSKGGFSVQASATGLNYQATWTH